MDTARENAHSRSSHGTGGNSPFDLNKLINSTACNISLGIVLLLVGVVVTVMTFMEHRATNKIFLLGPILVGAGVLGVGKALLKKYRFGDIDQRRRRRRRSRHLHRAMEIRENTQPISDVSIHVEHGGSNFCRSQDEPPPYHIITLLSSESALISPIPRPEGQSTGLTETMLPKYSESDPIPPPPKYEEVIDVGEVNVSYSNDDTSHILEPQEDVESLSSDVLDQSAGDSVVVMS